MFPHAPTITVLMRGIYCMSVCALFLALSVNAYASEQVSPPVLISETTSTRAIALESVKFTREPFSPNSTYAWSADQRTRVILFALNLNLQPNEDLSVVTADAEDASHQHHDLKVEYVGPVPLQEWMSAVVLRLSDDLGDVGDVLVRVSYHGVNSNRVRIGIGHLGGGSPDDVGANPTPAPPYTISGQIKAGAQGLGGVSVMLNGAQTATAVTNEDGFYSLTVNKVGDYTITPSKQHYIFNPPQQTFNHLGDNQKADFSGALRQYAISGRVTEGGVQGLPGMTLSLGGSQTGTTVTNSDGSYTFFATALGGYTVTLQTSKILSFTPQTQNLTSLTSDHNDLNFTGARKLYTVSGQVRDYNGNVVNDLPVTLSDVAGTSSRTVLTKNGGAFSFADVTAGFSYTVTVDPTYIFNFIPQTISSLSDNLSLNFAGIRRSYALSGTVADASGQGMGGVVLKLADGPSEQTYTTGADGNYFFGNLPAGEYFTLTPIRTDYIFTPATRQIYTYDYQGDMNFTGFRAYTISGKVVTTTGEGLGGVTLTAAGPQTVKAISTSDGSYSLTITMVGDYFVTPSIGQDYYSFNPLGQSFRRLSSNQTLNFTAQPATFPDPFYVLEFDGSQESVDYGPDYWPALVDLGPCYWEFWTMPGQNAAARYLISDGYGGAHAVLFGFNNQVGGRYTLTGNTWDGSSVISFGSGEGPATNEWAHVAVGYDGRNFITYEDGVPVGKQPFSGPRISPGGGWGATWPLIGGSDHSNFQGRIAQVRGYEGTDPRAASPESSFTPQTLFSRGGQLLSYYFTPAQTVADLSLGFNGIYHPGTVRGTAKGIPYDCPGCPTPQFVLDPTAPDFSHPDRAGQTRGLIDTAPKASSAALIFDSFSRPNATYILNGLGGLGQTEKGNVNWHTGVAAVERQPFGILNGRAVLLADSKAMAWVETGRSDLDVRVDRFAGLFADGVDTGLSFRVADAGNYFFAYTSESSQSSDTQVLTVGFYQNGQRANLVTGVNVPANWTTLRVITTSAGNVNVYADETLLYSTTNSLMAGATGAGIYNDSPSMALVNRWDNFTVYNAP